MHRPLSVAEIKDAVRIEEVIRGRGLELVANPTGERLVAHCPFHLPDHTPSFNVYIASQRYHCFGCGADGDVINFVEQFDGCSFYDALTRLASAVPVLPVPRLRPQVRRAPLPRPLDASRLSIEQQEVLCHLCALYQQNLFEQPAVLDYLAERGISRESAQICRLGYAGGAQQLFNAHSPLQQVARTMGVLTTRGTERLAGRLIIPEISEQGCQWMIGRSLPVPPVRKGAKYLGLSLAKPLLGASMARKRIEQNHENLAGLLVVEGALDYVLAGQWDLPVICVALLGTYASRQQLADLLALQSLAGNVPILLALDNDEAGARGTTRLVEQLEHLKRETLVLLPIVEAKDFGELARKPDGRILLLEQLKNVLFPPSIQR